MTTIRVIRSGVSPTRALFYVAEFGDNDNGEFETLATCATREKAERVARALREQQQRERREV